MLNVGQILKSVSHFCHLIKTYSSELYAVFKTSTASSDLFSGSGFSSPRHVIHDHWHLKLKSLPFLTLSFHQLFANFFEFESEALTPDPLHSLTVSAKITPRNDPKSLAFNIKKSTLPGSLLSSTVCFNATLRKQKMLSFKSGS